MVAATSVILALAGGSAFASDGSVESASDAAERKTCKRGQLTLRVRGGARPSARRPARRICQKLPRIGSSPATGTRAATAVLQSNALAARNRGLRRVLSRKRVRRHVARLAQRVTRRMTVPAASGAGRQSETRSEGRSTTTITEPGSDELGRGVESEDSATQGGVSATFRIRDQLFVNRCPDSNGDVPGEVNRLYAMRLSSMVDGRRANLETELRWTGKLEAHVGDDAALRDFDLQIAGTGGASETSGAGRVFRFNIEQRGIDPRAPNKPASVSGDVRSSQGGNLSESQLAGLRLMLGVALTTTRSDAAKLYLRAEDHWNRDAKCLTARFSPAEQHLERGEQAPLDVSVLGADGQPVAIGLDATALDGAQVSPGRAETTPSPARFTVTAPEGKFSSARIQFSGRSKRGRVAGEHTIREVKTPRFRITFSGSVSSSSSYEFQDSASNYLDTGQQSGSGSWTLVWRDVELRLDQSNLDYPQACGGLPACATGSGQNQQTYHLEQEDPEGNVVEYDNSCTTQGLTPSSVEDSFFTLNRPEYPEEPLPPVPSARFTGFHPGLYWAMECTDSTTPPFGLDSPFDWVCQPDPSPSTFYITPDFYVPLTRLKAEDSFTVSVAGGSGGSSACVVSGSPPDSGSFSLAWSGAVTFDRLEP